MIFKTGAVRRNLCKKGFVVKNSHHAYFYFYRNGKRTDLYTYLSHGSDSRDLDHRILSRMKAQLGLDSHWQLQSLLQCTMSESQYVRWLIDNEKLPKH